MSNTLNEVARQLIDTQKKVQLVYAFNGTGKTRLSREFKELINPKTYADEMEEEQADWSNKKIIYYSAFTEDLFYWDNDLAQDSLPRLNIQPNSFTDWLLQFLKDQGQDGNIVTFFQDFTNSKLTPHFSEDLSKVTFSLERGGNDSIHNIKISKGEESNFIWSIFYTLLSQIISVLNILEPDDRETNNFDELQYIFIDDPVSSLDENHLIQLAVHLAKLMKISESKLQFIISTHNPLFYNVLYNETKAKEGNILRRYDDGSFELQKRQGDSNQSLSYHLYLKRLLEQAIEQREIQRYHFVLLRNLYEKVCNFLGYQNWTDLLPGDQKAYAQRVMNFYSHRTLSNEEVAEPTEPEKQMVNVLLQHLLNNYGFWKPEEQNG